MSGRTPPPGLLLVGGGAGLLGRALGPRLTADFAVRSIHRHPNAAEVGAGVEWIPVDVGPSTDWDPLLRGVRFVVNLAWYRTGPATRFERLQAGLIRLIGACRTSAVERFVHVSVPAAPSTLETGLPYLVYKRRVDRALADSGLSYRILRPTAMFGARDVLLGEMFRLIRRYPVFPMFGDGEYHLSPIAADDVADAIRQELGRSDVGTVDLGGPRRFRYRELTDLMFELAGKRPHYWRLSPSSSIGLARWMERLGSHLLYAYEVEWLLSDLLGLPAYQGLDRPLLHPEAYLEGLAGRRSDGREAGPGGLG